MSEQPLDQIEEQLLSKQTANSLTLVDIRLNKISAELHNAAPILPLQTEAELERPEYERPNNRLVVYYLAYRFSAKDRQGRPVWDAAFTLSVSFRVKSGVKDVQDRALKVFGESGVIEIAHPYVRELMHHVTGRMNV